MYMGFQEAPSHYESGPQKARIWTERWAREELYCPSCGAGQLQSFPANSRVADFYCSDCSEEYELKAKKGRFGPRVTDGAYGSMCERLAAQNNPSLVLMNYDLASFGVTDLFVVPKHFFVQDIIIPRKPLSLTAKRVGWIGCNIQISAVPDAGKIFLVRDGKPVARSLVMEAWRRTLFLRESSTSSRGWLIEVLKAVEAIGRETFALDEVYAQEARLQRAYPRNNNVRPKIRQQLQVLRDQGLIEFVGRGKYRLQS